MAQMAGPSEALEKDLGRRGQYGPSESVCVMTKLASVNLEIQGDSIGLIAAVGHNQALADPPKNKSGTVSRYLSSLSSTSFVSYRNGPRVAAKKSSKCQPGMRSKRI
jgi:hypothetical protein